jgi:hypothetical protein
MAELVGLNEIANNANLTFVAFIAFFLIAVLGIRFGLYAYWNGKANDVDAQVPLWGYLVLIGLSAALYGLVGVVRIVLTVFGDSLLNLASGLMLALVLCLALAFRTVSVSAAFAGREPAVEPSAVDRWLVVAFTVLVALSTLGMVALPDLRRPFAVAHGVAGVAFLAYGYRFGQEQLARVQVQGTLLDTLLRHLLPVLLFASLIPIMELTWVAGIPRTVVLYVQIVFVIMTATTLMTATIKLRQNLAGMR